MTSEIVMIGMLGIALLLAGGAIFLIVYWLFSRDDLSPRLEAFVQDERGRSTNPWIAGMTSRTREFSGSFTSRVVLPSIKQIGRFFQRLTPSRSIELTQHQLLIAGSPYGMGVTEFMVIRVVFVILGFISFLLILNRLTEPVYLLLGILALVSAFLLPPAWLRGRMRRRQNLVRRGLPDALDMLSVCADAGLGFDQSLQKVSEHWNNIASYEFGRVVAEMEMGVSRREALRNLANRVDIPELSSFVAVIIQSDQLGMSISQTLHSQADQMRVERRFRAQEIARTVPVKMLLPLVFLIFPALIAVIMGPAIPPLIELFSSF